jgi:hypothetical protein
MQTGAQNTKSEIHSYPHLSSPGPRQMSPSSTLFSSQGADDAFSTASDTESEVGSDSNFNPRVSKPITLHTG